LSEERYADAALQFEAARAIDPSENSAYSHLAVAYRHLGQPEKAKEVLSALQRILEQQRSGSRAQSKAPPGRAPQ
jgi:Tfp pilus assembly protein PilF